MSAEPQIDIRPLTAERVSDLLGFFDGPAFADNPDPLPAAGAATR
jgi:hypothetical protein